MIDVILLVVIVSYAVSGYRQGLAVGALSLGGFLVGALLAMAIVPPMAAGLQQGIQRSFTVLVCVLLFAWLGSVLDRHLGTRPAFLIVGVFVGAGASIYSMYRKVMANTRGPER